MNRKLKVNMFLKYTLICLVLFLLQLLRIIFKELVFLNVERTIISDTVVSIVYMLIIIFIGYIIIKQKKLKLSIFPKKFSFRYILISIFLILFLFVTPIITRSYELINILSLFYNAIITVIYEEIIFRGFVYKVIDGGNNSFKAYVISSILFTIWHLGYIDTIIWRTSMFHHDVNILNIMFWKVMTGLVLGIIFGFFRYKNRNVYSSMIVHSFINGIGG